MKCEIFMSREIISPLNRFLILGQRGGGSYISTPNRLSSASSFGKITRFFFLE